MTTEHATGQLSQNEVFLAAVNDHAIYLGPSDGADLAYLEKLESNPQVTLSEGERGRLLSYRKRLKECMAARN